MIELQSKTHHRSALLPEVMIVVRKMSMGVRMELRNATGAFARDQLLASEEFTRLAKEFNASIAGLPKEEQDLQRWPPELTVALERSQELQEQIDRAYLRTCLVAVEGVTIDGHAVGADDIIERCGPEFFRDVVDIIKGEYGLSERAKGESAPPTTSSAPAGGETKSTSAETANGADTTCSATAGATFLPT